MESLLNQVASIAVGAGREIMAYYGKQDFMIKEDKTPVTEADYAAHHFICTHLRHVSAFPISSEEGELRYDVRRELESYWLIDPLDGTKGFIEKDDGFSVNIALIKYDRPVLGVVYAPALSLLYFACEGHGAYRVQNADTDSLLWQKERLRGERVIDDEVLVGCDSIHHSSAKTQAFFEHYHLKRKVCGSSLKICSVAEGSADVYPRFNGTKEWDIAAAHVVLRETGGEILACDTQQALTYNKPSVKNPHFVAFGRTQMNGVMYCDVSTGCMWQ